MTVYEEYVSRKLKYITTWKINWKFIFSGINWLFQNFKSLNNLIFIHFFFLMNYVPNHNGKVLEETLADFDLDVWKQHGVVYIISKWSSLFYKFFKNLFPFLCHLVTYNREYYEWLSRLRSQNQIGRLPVQTPQALV